MSAKLPLVCAIVVAWQTLTEFTCIGTLPLSSAGDQREIVVNHETLVRVEAVYPTASELPENLLRFYVYFSKPMRPKTTNSSIKLVDEGGQYVENVFLPTQSGLWSSDRRRLTIYFNPGRVKSGLQANNTFGLAIRSGQRYSLVIEGSAQALDGSTLRHSFTKTFRVTNPDRGSPSPCDWELSQPQRDSMDPLEVTLDEPLDHTSLAFHVRVLDKHGVAVRGRIRLSQNEQRWSFTPQSSWRSGPYWLRVAAELEDLAGNRSGGLFEDVAQTGFESNDCLVPVALTATE